MEDTSSSPFILKITCPICLEVFVDARNLSCHHTFCAKCILQMTKNQRISCALCRTETPATTNLPKNYVVNDIAEYILKEGLTLNSKKILCNECDKKEAVKYCQNCQVSFCQDCLNAIHSSKSFSKHLLANPSNVSNILCSTHPDEKLKFWCRTCSKQACRDCILLTCKTHNYVDESTAFKELKETVTVKVPLVQKKKQQLEEVKKKIEASKALENKSYEDSLKVIEEQFEALIARIRNKKMEIVQSFKENHQKQQETLGVAEKDITSSLENIELHSMLIKDLEKKEVTNFQDTVKLNTKILKFVETLPQIEPPSLSMKACETQSITSSLRSILQKTKKLALIYNTVTIHQKPVSAPSSQTSYF